MHALLVRIDRQTAGDIARQVVWDDRSVDTLIDRQIDQLRDMINAGRPRTALDLLWGGLREGVEGRIRFRVKANITACLLRLGDERKAAETYLDAYRHARPIPKLSHLRCSRTYFLTSRMMRSPSAARRALVVPSKGRSWRT
jgi:hypothetical protein